MFNFDVPYHIDGRGQTAGTRYLRHVLDMLELFIFTNPGDRVNRPDFGGCARDLVFDCNSFELAAALKISLQANLRRWLADRIDVQDVVVENDDSTLRIQVQYSVPGRDDAPQSAQLPRLF
jgi:phage baseplate assembly protein W